MTKQLKPKLNKYYTFDYQSLYWEGRGIYAFNKSTFRYERVKSIEDAEFYVRHSEVKWVEEADLTPSVSKGR